MARSRPVRCGAQRPARRGTMFFPPGTSSSSLHRQYHSLLRELKDAELALGEDASEANMAWLRDIKARLSEMDGTEAMIEGFGELSGRFQREWSCRNENLCGRPSPEPQKDSPNPWFGGKNRVKRRLMALRHFRRLSGRPVIDRKEAFGINGNTLFEYPAHRDFRNLHQGHLCEIRRKRLGVAKLFTPPFRVMRVS